MNIAVIGLGCRGSENIRTLCRIEGVRIVSICDLYEDRIEKAKDFLRSVGHDPETSVSYEAALSVKGLDAVFVFTGWQSHSEIAIYAMKAGVPVACEVGGEYSLERCFKLVETYEDTSTPYMLLENCCYGEKELLATAAARQGLFGRISFCSGAYTHDIREEIAYGHIRRHYRFDNYRLRCCDNYPTHDLGPIAKLLNINRGNRIISLVSMSSAANGLESYIAGRDDADEAMRSAKFRQGDIVETLLTCENGELIRLHLDTTLPTSYTRDFTIRGTKGAYYQFTDSFFFDGDRSYWDPCDYIAKTMKNSSNFSEYIPSIWKNISEEERKKGHGGMDYFCFKSFLDAVKNGCPMPIDVYDAATWMAVSVLSEKSIAEGGTVQYMPDFTHGMWMTRKPLDVTEL